jgi:glycosyltransferase involved in cell wall biosynthesis
VYSLIIPVYMNEGSIKELLVAVEFIHDACRNDLEAVFVVDGSPDRCGELLAAALPKCRFRSKLVILSRNFGSFAAIRAGLGEAEGDYFAVMAADLQEPPELIVELFQCLESEPVDIAIGVRGKRDDPLASQWSGRFFWHFYRRFIQPEMPPGGVDIFACRANVRDRLLEFDESNSSLIGQLFWVGFRRKSISYRRQARVHGESAWTFAKKLRYLTDSIFAFSDLPIRLLTLVGALGMMVSIGFGSMVFVVRWFGLIPIPGYAALVITVAFFAALNLFGLGVIGSYVWRAFENTKGRPHSIVMQKEQFDGRP